MIEENTVMLLVEGIKTGDISVIIGLVIIALVAITRNAVLPELTGVSNQVVSSIAGALGGIAVLLVAGQIWWAALIVGLLAAPTSGGLIPLIRSIIRAIKRKPPSSAQGGHSDNDRLTPTERPTPKGRSTRLIVPAVLVLMLCMSSFGCAGVQRPCDIEKTLVNSVGAGLSATESAIGDSGGENYEVAMVAANGVHLLGQQAVAACELARDGAAWQQWVLLALETIGAVVGVIEGANEEIEQTAPVELRIAIQNLESEANLL